MAALALSPFITLPYKFIWIVTQDPIRQQGFLQRPGASIDRLGVVDSAHNESIVIVLAAKLLSNVNYRSILVGYFLGGDTKGMFVEDTLGRPPGIVGCDGQMSIRVNITHLTGFSFPVILVTLDYA